MAERRVCFLCRTNLSPKSRPTRYDIVEWDRKGAPHDLYLCASCANTKFEELKPLYADWELSYHNTKEK